MCGIAGIISARSTSPAGPLREMAARLVHRGPDDEGYLETTSAGWFIGLAHRRLAIIDLSTGHQPLTNEDGSVCVVFNGEIYNFMSLREELLSRGHVFRTRSDTETIAHAYEEYGDACVERLRGMFAFALWDARRARLLLARDRFGEKPLYLNQAPDQLCFASEVHSLLAAPGMRAQLDESALCDYFQYRYVPGPATLLAGVHKLPPATYAVWQAGQLAVHRYFGLPDGTPRGAEALPEDPVGGFLAKLDQSVALRMISDVPFGAFLSGGLDSSAIVALMQRHSRVPVRTFSVGFLSTEYDERQHAAVVARSLRTEHHELAICENDVVDQIPRLTRFRGAPVAEPSDVALYLLAREARKSVKMVLSGEGADEVLGGYPKHVFERYVRPYALVPAPVHSRLIEPLVMRLPYRFHRAKTAVCSMGERRFETRMPRWFGAMSRRQRGELLTICESERASVPLTADSRNTPLRNILHFDQGNWLPDNLLERGDRMTMATSLEARMPFLDQELVSFVSSLPDHYRVRGRTTKWILRSAMARILPRSTVQRPKVGFRVPVGDWFRGPMRGYLHDHLAGPGCRTRVYYRAGALEAVLDEHMRRRQNHEKLLWCALALEVWHREIGL